MSYKLLSAGLLLFSSTVFGALIPVGEVPLTGQGLGNVMTLLTFTSPNNETTESGCVAGGVGGEKVTGSGACPFGIDGGNEQAINNVYTAAQVGITDFADIQLIFNASENNNDADRSITIEALALTLWDPANGDLVGAFYLENSYFIADPRPGAGNAGFGFQLDAEQAQAANDVFTAFPNLRIGVAATASDATGGLETISVRSLNTGGGGPSEIPEPATYALAISALAGMAGWRKFRTR